MKLDKAGKPASIWTGVKKIEVLLILGAKPVSDVARETGIDKKKLLSACNRFKWSYAFKKKPPSKRLTTEQKFFIKRYAGVKSVREISNKLNVKQGQVRDYAYRKNFSVRMPSSESVHSYISDEDVRLMRELNDAGISTAEISRKFEISAAHAWTICKFMGRTDVL